MDLERKQEQRRRFLRGLYEATNGHRFNFAQASDVATTLGLTPEEANSVTDYLVGQGLMKWQTLGGVVSITPEGVQEAERAMAEEKQQPPPSRIPTPVIAEVAQAFESEYTHAQIDNLFMRADALVSLLRGQSSARWQSGCGKLMRTPMLTRLASSAVF